MTVPFHALVVSYHGLQPQNTSAKLLLRMALRQLRNRRMCPFAANPAEQKKGILMLVLSTTLQRAA